MRTLALLLALVLVASVRAEEAQPSATPAPATSGTAKTSSNGYRLYPGDLVLIQVFDNPDLEREIRVPDSGNITYPLIGDVKDLVGRTVDDLTKELSRRLMDGYLRQAVVTITVREFGKRSATVMGSVSKPGPVDLDPLRDVTAMQAIGQAGGFSDDANRVGAMVIRENGRQALQVPKGDKPEDLANDIVLRPGDIIIVPRLDRVYIIGLVNKPGSINLPSLESVTVSKAISLAGGFDKYANKNSVMLHRAGERPREINVGKILKGDGGDDPQLKPGDVISVPESRL
jgi:polysaccharide export outer membrane protein